MAGARGFGSGGGGASGGGLYITQAAWAVDPVAGNDSGPGTPAQPLLTLAELGRRINGRLLSPAISAMTISLAAGTYTQPLLVQPVLPLLTQSLVVSGTMTQIYAGAITAFTPWNAAGGVRSAITDAAANFAASLGARIRMTSGPALDGLSAYNSIAAPTICHPNSFALSLPSSPTSVSIVTPAAGNSFVLETPASVLAQGAFVWVGGSGKTIVRDLSYVPSSAGTRFYAAGGGSGTRCVVLGVHFGATATAAPIVTGCATWAACYMSGPFGPSMIAQEPSSVVAASFFNTGAGAMQGYWLGNNLMHDPNAGGSGQLQIINGAHLQDIGAQAGHCFFNCTGGASLVELKDGGEWHQTSASCFFWGAAGNTAAASTRIFNGSGMVSVNRPAATGAVPGTDLILAGAPAIAWAAWPAVAVPPSNAYALARV